MGKKPVSILQRERAQTNAQRHAYKKQKRAHSINPPPLENPPQGSQAAAREGGGRRQHAHQQGRSSEPQHGLRPVSNVHLQASRAVERLLRADATKRGGTTLKSLTLGAGVSAKKATYAVTVETLKHLPVLRPLLERTQLAERGGLAQAVALVMAYETLFGEGLRPVGQAERAVLQRKADLQAALQQLLAEAGAQAVCELLAQPGPTRPHPRTVRVNTIKMSVQEALAWLRAPPAEHKKWAAVGLEAELDPLLPDLLSLPPRTDLHDHPLVASGALVLQSRASCMPAHALAPQPGWAVVDACAAPGNKTTHLAALMANRGTITAFEKDPQRLARLRANIAAMGASCVAPQLADFLTIDPEAPAYRNVQAVLLDPSCSGSGTAYTRMDYLLPSAANILKGPGAVEYSDARVEALARFQQACVRHALRFPALRRLVYSTCSVHAAENEAVVAAVLPDAIACGFRLAPALPGWPRRGVAGLVEGAEHLARVDPDLDGTDGFFVALFVREGGDQPGQTQEQLRTRTVKTRRKQAQQLTAEEPGGQNKTSSSRAAAH